MLVLEFILRDDDESKIRSENDGGDDRGRDGQHKGNDPWRFVVHAARCDDRHKREESEGGGDWVQHEQEGESFENEVRQLRLVRHDRDELRIDRVPELWTDALAIVSEQRWLI